MKQTCRRVPGTKAHVDGFVSGYVEGVVQQWLLVAPKANPAMLEMFRDRDASPLRQLVPWAGEFAGKYLTAAVQVLRLTGSEELRAWLKQFVAMFVGLQDKDGYLGPWPKRCRMTNKTLTGECTWDTWGHYHAMMGLMLWHEESRDAAALECARRIGDMLCRKFLGRKKPRLVDTGCTEMNLAPAHSLCLLYRKTNDKRYLAMALQIVDEFAAEENGTPLAGDYLRQALEGREFFQNPKPRWESLHPIMALAELYWITGDNQYRLAFEHLWWSIARYDRHNNGGFSSGEKATGNAYDHAPIETCCTIAWAAMSVEMLKMTGDPLVADELELSTLNSVAGSHSATGRWATYDTPMSGVRCASAHSIVFQSREGSPELNCCSVNAARGFGMLSDWALMKDNRGLILNYYGSSEFRVKLKPGVEVALRQETGYPVEGRVKITVSPSKPAAFTLKLRIPQWSTNTTVAVNGRKLRQAEPGRYCAIDRTWKAGDSIALELDMSLHTWPGKRECTGLASLFRGPLLLAYDHRYNLDNAPKTPAVRDVQKWDAVTCMLDVPPFDARSLAPRRASWHQWLPPLILLEFRAARGKIVRLCDFASAGAAGTPYRSWLPVLNCPCTPAFSRERPLRTVSL